MKNKDCRLAAVLAADVVGYSRLIERDEQDTLEWLQAREAELLPVPYFHVVSTLPAALGALAYQNKAKVYGLLLKAAAETLTTIAADPKHLGARIGVTTVLHSWGQTLDHHPHVHCIVPAAAISLDGSRWIACRPGFFLPVRVLSRLFRRLFLEELEEAHGKENCRIFDIILSDGFAIRSAACQVTPRLAVLRPASVSPAPGGGWFAGVGGGWRRHGRPR
jgi:hypothetical protein